jgi:hypothetical protein
MAGFKRRKPRDKYAYFKKFTLALNPDYAAATHIASVTNPVMPPVACMMSAASLVNVAAE